MKQTQTKCLLQAMIQWWVYVLDGKEGRKSKRKEKKNNEQESYKTRMRSTTSDLWDYFSYDDSKFNIWSESLN